MEYFPTGRGNFGLRINDYIYKRHYETQNSIYWICTLSNKLKCKQRAIAEKDKPYSIRFKGKGHNHALTEYQCVTRIKKKCEENKEKPAIIQFELQPKLK